MCGDFVNIGRHLNRSECQCEKIQLYSFENIIINTVPKLTTRYDYRSYRFKDNVAFNFYAFYILWHRENTYCTIGFHCNGISIYVSVHSTQHIQQYFKFLECKRSTKNAKEIQIFQVQKIRIFN